MQSICTRVYRFVGLDCGFRRLGLCVCLSQFKLDRCVALCCCSVPDDTAAAAALSLLHSSFQKWEDEEGVEGGKSSMFRWRQLWIYTLQQIDSAIEKEQQTQHSTIEVLVGCRFSF